MPSKPSIDYPQRWMMHIKKFGAGSRNPKKGISLCAYCHGYSTHSDLYEWTSSRKRSPWRRSHQTHSFFMIFLIHRINLSLRVRVSRSLTRKAASSDSYIIRFSNFWKKRIEDYCQRLI